MKRCYYNCEFIKNESNEIIGVNLGYNTCAEHDWGIKSLQYAFGLKIKNKKVNSKYFSNPKFFKNTILPDTLTYNENGVFTLTLTKQNLTEDLLKILLKHDIYIEEGKDIGAAWDEDTFAINVNNKYKYVLENLYYAFQNKNGIIKVNNGLILLDYNKIPEEAKKDFRKYISKISPLK